MPRLGRRGGLASCLSIFFLLALFSASGQAANEDSYVLAIAKIEDRGLKAGERAFLASFPGLLVEGLKELPPRLAGPSYLEEKAAALRLKSLIAAGTELQARLDEAALRALEPGVPEGKRSQNLSDARDKAAAARKKLDELDASSPAGSAGSGAGQPQAAPRKAPLSVSLLSDNLSGSFPEIGAAGPQSALQGKGVSLIVYGYAEDSSGYVALSLSGYDTALGKVLFSWRDYADPDDPAPLAAELAERLSSWVAGADYARIVVDLQPPSAYLLADGLVLGAGDRVIYRFEPGILRLEAALPGHEAKALDLPYALGDRKSVGLVLAAEAEGQATIATKPEGASLSLGGLPLGPSPATAPLSGRRSVVSASAPGYETAEAILPASGSATVEISLRPEDGLGPDGRIKAAKDSFYGALGLFVLSLPLASISYAVNWSYYEAAYRSGDATMISDYYSSEWVFGGALALSAAAAINTAIRLVRYIGATR